MEHLELGVVDEGERYESDYRDDGADDYERRAAAPFGPAFIGKRAEQGQHEQREYVIQRHNDAGPALRHAELIRKYLGDDVIVRLPEGADEEECETHAYRPPVFELHKIIPPYDLMRIVTVF